MTTITVKFDDKDEFESWQKGPAALSALWDVSQEVFRPARKHGYSDPEINKLVQDNEHAEELVGKLEELFCKILRERGVEL